MRDTLAGTCMYASKQVNPVNTVTAVNYYRPFFSTSTSTALNSATKPTIPLFPNTEPATSITTRFWHTIHFTTYLTTSPTFLLAPPRLPTVPLTPKRIVVASFVSRSKAWWRQVQANPAHSADKRDKSPIHLNTTSIPSFSFTLGTVIVCPASTVVHLS